MKEEDKGRKTTIREAFIGLGVATGAIAGAVVIAMTSAMHTDTYSEVTIACSSHELQQTFHNAAVTRETAPQWPVASPITVREHATGKVSKFSGNDCVVLPVN
jgi:hypothetical protein